MLVQNVMNVLAYLAVILTIVLIALEGRARDDPELELLRPKPKLLLGVEEEGDEEEADEMAQGECCPPAVVPELPEEPPLLAPLEPKGEMGLFFQG